MSLHLIRFVSSLIAHELVCEQIFLLGLDLFNNSSLIYVFIVCCLKSRFYFFLYLYFLHTCGYAFCLSVSENIQVNSIKLLSTLATDR